MRPRPVFLGSLLLTVEYFLRKPGKEQKVHCCFCTSAHFAVKAENSPCFFFSFVFQNKRLIELAQCRCLSLWLLGIAKWKDGVMILNWSCLDPTQMQLSPSYLHFRHKPRSLFWKQMLPSLWLQHVIWYTALQYETIFSHCIAVAVWEDFVPPQCHNNLISSHLLGEISFFISLSGDAKQIAWHDSLLALQCTLSFWDPIAF